MCGRKFCIRNLTNVFCIINESCFQYIIYVILSPISRISEPSMIAVMSRITSSLFTRKTWFCLYCFNWWIYSYYGALIWFTVWSLTWLSCLQQMGYSRICSSGPLMSINFSTILQLQCVFLISPASFELIYQQGQPTAHDFVSFWCNIIPVCQYNSHIYGNLFCRGQVLVDLWVVWTIWHGSEHLTKTASIIHVCKLSHSFFDTSAPLEEVVFEWRIQVVACRIMTHRYWY